jgi:hypothetical protein
MRRALGELRGCEPEYGRGVAAAMSAERTTDDSASGAFVTAMYLPHPAITRAAADIARDPSASELARLLSFMVFYSHFREVQVPFVELGNQPRGTPGCIHSIRTDMVRPRDLAPLPPDAPEQARDAALAVQRDPASSAALVGVSYCVLEAWRQARHLPSQHNWLFTPGGIAAEYVCGTTFNVRNSYPVPVAPQMEIGSSRRYEIHLVAAPSVDEPSATEVDIRKPGALTLFLDGEFLSVTENRGTPCRR